MISQVGAPHTLGFVIPVFSGEAYLEELVSEILKLASKELTPGGNFYKVHEIVLAHDGGTTESASAIRRLMESYPIVRARWLTRNFGQHPATLAGVSTTSSDWVITLDEDGQFDPADVPTLLDVAIETQSPLVYGISRSQPPHSRMRNFASAITKNVVSRLLVGPGMAKFTSFRLILGEIARGVAAYAGPGVYLDVALFWTVSRHQTVPVKFRQTVPRVSSYSRSRLFGHFWRLVLSSGTKPLRFVTYVGVSAASGGVALSVLVILRRVIYGFPIGFASVFVALLLIGGLILVSIGVIAEYIGLIARSTVGRPLYITQPDPRLGPLFRNKPLEQ